MDPLLMSHRKEFVFVCVIALCTGTLFGMWQQNFSAFGFMTLITLLWLCSER